ncbi:hypothetical protein FGO68_gene4457 [Halteria grandinella]|uniref:Uncharacterized protein n=1 Tax=Halteria grandinella TaxID=5974 RepID=A0A8J8SXG4_HALGN|nr:hypothetical protein FGO68_gene4457 [Halteria grandinella]
MDPLSKQKFEHYLSLKPEFKSEETLHAYYMAYDQTEEEEYLIVFWREVLTEYFSHVTQKVSLRKSDLVKVFTLHNRKPAGLSAVIDELIKRESFITRDQVLSGDHYGQKQSASITSRLASALYNNTLGWLWGSPPAQSEEDDKSEIVCVEYLKRKADSILHWSHTIGKQVFSEKTLKKYLTQLKLSASDIELLLAHLKHTNSLIQEQVDLGSLKVTLIKLLPNSEEAYEITEKEKAKFILDSNIQSLSDKIEQTVAKIGRLTENIKSMLKLGSKKNALILLQQKKKLETFWEKIQQQKFLLEDQLLNLEELETHSVILDSLQIAEKAGKSLQRDLESYEDLFERIDEQKSAQEQINALFAGKVEQVEEDSVLLDELEQLEAEQVLENGQLTRAVEQQRVNVGQQKVKVEKQQREIDMLERELEELSFADTASQREEVQQKGGAGQMMYA